MLEVVRGSEGAPPKRSPLQLLQTLCWDCTLDDRRVHARRSSCPSVRERLANVVSAVRAAGYDHPPSRAEMAILLHDGKADCGSRGWNGRSAPPLHPHSWFHLTAGPPSPSSVHLQTDFPDAGMLLTPAGGAKR
jgi:hypothetical protein